MKRQRMGMKKIKDKKGEKFPFMLLGEALL